jgi:hypothetical protein
MKRTLNILKLSSISISIVVSVFVIIMISPLGRIVEKGINLHLMSINNRLHSNDLTMLDKLECKLLYGGIIVAGKFISPEGFETLNHYINGYGSDYFLDPGYIKELPVVRRNLAAMKVGETKIVTFSQNEDWRLSYAVNPFRLKKEIDRILIWQKIEFLKRKDVYTVSNFGIFKLRLQDGLIHALEPKPFTVRCMLEI